MALENAANVAELHTLRAKLSALDDKVNFSSIGAPDTTMAGRADALEDSIAAFADRLDHFRHEVRNADGALHTLHGRLLRLEKSDSFCIAAACADSVAELREAVTFLMEYKLAHRDTNNDPTMKAAAAASFSAAGDASSTVRDRPGGARNARARVR